MILSKATISAIKPQAGVSVPNPEVFSYPEKVLQFGTGVLLRGLPDYFIDKANKQGIFRGRVVVVKSTSQGGDGKAFEQQDNLYTHHIKGIVNGKLVEETAINASISRVLSAQDQWDEVLKVAVSKDLSVIFSNTTEVGITLVKENIKEGVPSSFPGKLLAVLYKRYQDGGGNSARGLVIIPTELISDNGTKLCGIVKELAEFNELDAAFMTWLTTANEFCNSLVDRIVPGKLPAQDKAAAEAALGYSDDLAIMSEYYSLWAIEVKSEENRARLSFSEVDESVKLAYNIQGFKELKLRLLNGTHTFSCGLAVLAGFDTVKAAMQDQVFEGYVSSLMQEDIASAIISDIIKPEAAAKFAGNVIDRFKNPHIEHHWLAITLQYTSKMNMRNVPNINWYYEKFNSVPARMALGMAAYIRFMRSEKNAEGKFTGTANGKEYLINDDKAELLHDKWKQHKGLSLVQSVLSETALWGNDLSALPGFADAVAHYLDLLETKPALEVVAQLKESKVIG